MGGIALLAREQGYKVTGSDANVYPPMSTQLEAAGIELMEGYLPDHLVPAPDCVVVGNAMTRGNPAVEYMLNEGLNYTSGPQWLAENVLQGKWVLAVSGTHGKTTTASMLAWILESTGHSPGFLIGGVPANFDGSARRGRSDYFVVEADEYDTAFFDKRSKFIHYRPRTLTINNLEFDHADIFDDLAAIQRQFHHLVRCVPSNGLIAHRGDTRAIDEVMQLGFWTPKATFGVGVDSKASWRAQLLEEDGSLFRLFPGYMPAVDVSWSLCGRHNVENALAALIAAQHVGVELEAAAAALEAFKGVKRRMELLGTVNSIDVYDDFAHHPTAIATTLQGAKAQNVNGRVIAVIEPRSNTMRMGQHRDALAASAAFADQVYWYQPPGMDWSLEAMVASSPDKSVVFSDIDQLVQALTNNSQPGDTIVIMSNGSFGGLHQKLLSQLEASQPQ